MKGQQDRLNVAAELVDSRLVAHHTERNFANEVSTGDDPDLQSDVLVRNNRRLRVRKLSTHVVHEWG